MAETSLLFAAALMLVGAMVATGAWLVRRRGPRYAMVAVGTATFAAGVAALAVELQQRAS